MPMQNDMPITIAASKSTPEIEFQYGGCMFSETGSSNNSVNNDGVIRCTDAERHADDDESIKIETGNRILIWRPFFPKPEVVGLISQPCIEITRRNLVCK